MNLTRGQRFAQWLISRLPPALISDTFQVLFAVVFIGLGISTLIAINEPTVLDRSLTLVLRIEWSTTFILGGVAQMWGIQKSSRAAERSGMLLCIIGCLTYALALFATGNPFSIVIGVVFLTIAAAYGIRMLVSTVAGVFMAKSGDPE